MFSQAIRCTTIIVFTLILSKDLSGWNFSLSQSAERLDGKFRELATIIEQEVNPTGTLTIAIANFTAESTKSSDNFGHLITEQLGVALSRSKRFKLVEQHQLEKILGRRKLEMSDLYDEETVKRLGRFEGVDALLIGTYWDYGEMIKLIAKLINIETAEQMGTGDVLLNKSLIPQRYQPHFEEGNQVPSFKLDGRYYIEAFQIDEIARVFVNNELAFEVEIPLYSPSVDYDNNFKRIEITNLLRPGENSLRFIVINRSLPLDWGRCGYGFKVFKDNELLWQDDKKYPRSYDPDGVFYDKTMTITVEDDLLKVHYLTF